MAGKRGISTYNTGRKDIDSHDVKREFARRIQAAMQSKGWNQSELARACDALLPEPTEGQVQNLSFGRDAISHYVTGKSLPRADRLPILAKALNVKEEDLLPAEGVPSAGRTAWRMVYRGDGNVFYSVNRTMTMRTANKISALLDEEDTRLKNRAVRLTRSVSKARKSK